MIEKTANLEAPDKQPVDRESNFEFGGKLGLSASLLIVQWSPGDPATLDECWVRRSSR